MKFRDRIKWRAVTLMVMLLPVGGLVTWIAYLYFQLISLSVPLALLFIVLAYLVGFSMSNTRSNNIDGQLSRMGDRELMQYVTLIECEIAQRAKDE